MTIVVVSDNRHCYGLGIQSQNEGRGVPVSPMGGGRAEEERIKRTAMEEREGKTTRLLLSLSPLLRRVSDAGGSRGGGERQEKSLCGVGKR